MAHSNDIDIDDIPKSTVRAVAKKLKYYIDVQRREEAFDLSGVEHPMGAFTYSKGGSLYYNSVQDKLTSHFLAQPQLKKYTSEMGLKSPTKASPRPYSAVMNFIKQESTMSQEGGKLVNTTSKLLLNSNIKHLDRIGSAPSTLRSPVARTASHHLNRPLSSNSTLPSTTNSDLASHSHPRKKRSNRQSKQSTPVTQSTPIVTSHRTKLQSTFQRFDLGSGISSTANNSQSSVTQSVEDDELLQYTYHNISRKPSLTDTLFTRSDSALCIPTIQRRTVTVNKNKVTGTVKKDLSFKEPTDDTIDAPVAVNNSSSLPLQVNQDSSIQVETSSFDQTADNKKAVVQVTTVRRPTVASTSVHSIGLQVTECQDNSTQTLSEVGIQTDLSAIMDQKRAERRQLKKQSRENISPDSSNPPTVIITSDSTEQLKQEVSGDITEQDLEAARKEELRRHVAATTIQQYYRGFKSGIRAKKSEQQMRDQEVSSAMKKIPAGISIHEAARTGNVDRIKELSMEASSLMNLLDERGYTPLHCAAENGSLMSVKMLSICGADMHKETSTGYTAIHIAALSGHVNCLKLLHALDCSLKCQTVDRKTPLHLAAMRGHLECCKWLLSNRAKLNVRDENNRTPLQLAEESEQPQIVDLLTTYENELKYAKGALKQLRARRSNSTEHTDDDGWLSDTKQAPDSPAIKYPSTIVEEQKQFYEQIQKDKETSDSTFLDVARIVVEKESQATEEQSDQHKLDSQHQQTSDQDQQHIDQGQKHIDQEQQNNDQEEHQGEQNNDQDIDNQDQQNHQDQAQQSNDQDHQSQQNHQDQAQQNDLDHQGQQKHQDQTQQNDQGAQDQVNNQDSDQGHSQQHKDQDPQLIDQSHSQQQINDQTNTDEPNNEQSGKTSTTEAENQDKTPTTSYAEAPIQTADTAQTSESTDKINNTEETDAVVIVQHEVEDAQKQQDEVTNHSSIQNIVTVTDEDTGTKPILPEPVTQDTPQESIQNSTTLSQDDNNGAQAATESENISDKVAELSVENLAAHDIANPPLIERTDTQQTLTTVTMLDNPIRFEQLSRSSLDSDYSKKHKHQQIVQTISTTAVNGDGRPNDDVIAITGTVDTRAIKPSNSSSTLSNVTDLTE